jgi:hypothetical protein
METQKFKGDAFELKMEAAGGKAFEATDLALEAMYDGCYQASDWLLSLYDNGRMPFSERVPRDSFVEFFKQALGNFQVTGTFEAYLFILEAIFGEGTVVLFDVPAAGKLEILVNAASSLEFGFQAREIEDGDYVPVDMATTDGELLQFRGISGIDSEAELTQLLAELIPAGIWTDIGLSFFSIYMFVAEDGAGDLYSVTDHVGNQIIFFEGD